MTAAAIHAGPPSLRRLAPWAIGFAVFVHVAALAWFAIGIERAGGGGGTVLGRMSIALGGAGVTAPATQAKPEPLTEAVEMEEPPEPVPAPSAPVKAPVEKKVERKAIVPPEVRPAPRPPQPVAKKPEPPKPVLRKPAPVEAPQPSEAASAQPPGAAQAGAPTLGEGAASQSVGLGASPEEAGKRADAYLAAIRARIERERVYPPAARRQRIEGTVTVDLRIGDNGSVAALRIVGGSGSFHLDRAAEQMVRKAAPFPAPPTSPFAATVPIVFALR